ncbi:MAG: glycosyltransferase family 2 protein [Candidatus Aureabacteria bacterium]|nr:glycosyltransferase family 2 protein [Candidatus Auribacterota bacterium]
MNQYSISMVLPMFNEKDYVTRTVALAIRTLDTITDDYEIIIVDDASTDGCGDIADRMSRDNRKIKVLHHKVNSKLGATLRTGFAAAQKNLVVYSDMDLPFDFEEIKKALRVMDLTDCDIVTVYRHDRTSEGLLRAVYSAGYNMLIRIMFGVRVRDINFSFKLFKRKILESMQLRSNGSFIDAELIIRAIRADHHVSQFGIDYFPRSRGTSTLSSPGIILTIFKEMISFRIRLFTRSKDAPPSRRALPPE